MRICKNLDRAKLIQLIINMLGIYIMYFISGILHERVLKGKFPNVATGQLEHCEDTMGMLIIPFLVAWIMAEIYNKAFLQQRVQIPTKNSFLAAFAVVVASAFSLLAIEKTSFPVIVMFQSCSIVPVVLVGVCCSRVRDENLKLGPKKIIVTLIITIGILLFQFSDPENRKLNQNQQFLGFLFLLCHFIAEGFLPDLQAEIKVQYKPQPTQMMCDINKWATFLNFILLVITLQIKSFSIFLIQHPLFTLYLFLLSILSGAGQFFVYRMIKQFKQHFVPFTITSRKILTVVLSIVFYKHNTSFLQVMGIVIVISAVTFEFLTEISKPQQEQEKKNQDIELNEENGEYIEDIQSNLSHKSSENKNETPKDSSENQTEEAQNSEPTNN